MTLQLIDAALNRAYTEIGKFEEPNLSAEDYINSMTNYEFLEFLSRVGIMIEDGE